MPALGGKAGSVIALRNVRYWPKGDIGRCAARVRFWGEKYARIDPARLATMANSDS
jgi:hypothetical protein